ncbi:MAG TPA: hypothetical protein VLT82_18960 [Myxococcaceae bacterium]|nr:hypothetical protein [Myxococcaceae bacterium]
MATFEILTSALLGVVAAVLLAAAGRWRAVGWQRTLVGGGVGGIVGGLVAYAVFAEGPSWGDLHFHPVTLAAALAGGAGVVWLLRLLDNGRRARHPPHAHRPGE